MGLNERMQQFISYLEISVKEFETKTGLSNGSVAKMGDNTRRSTLDKVSKTYPDLNVSWLLTGEGSMLLGGAVSNSNVVVGDNNRGSQTVNTTSDDLLQALNKSQTLLEQSQTLQIKSQEQIDRLLGIIERLQLH